MEEHFEKIIRAAGYLDYITPVFWDGEFSKPSTTNYRISVVTTVMNRLEALQMTLPENIKDNEDYDNVEFVVLNYGSTDNIDEWIKSTMAEHIESGKLVYYKTDEPKGYSMAHSRNICFKVATGDIVNSVDADNFVNPGFVSYVNKLANQCPSKVIFAKGKRLMRGRLGFYKDEFINQLGGYDERLTGYGSEDHDIVHRAWGLGYAMCWYGGQFYRGIPGHRKHQVDNFIEKDWKYTERLNKVISAFNLCYGRFCANQQVHWGKAKLLRNFTEEVVI